MKRTLIFGFIFVFCFCCYANGQLFFRQPARCTGPQCRAVSEPIPTQELEKATSPSETATVKGNREAPIIVVTDMPSGLSAATVAKYKEKLKVDARGWSLSTKAIERTFNASSSVAMQVLQLVNAERERRRLQPLELDESLATASEQWSSTMRSRGFRHGAGNEVIAMGGTTAEFAFRIWMNSPPHRAALLNPRYKKAGFGVSGRFWTGRFGR